MALSSKQTRYLRSLAHHLKPVVQVGDKGVTEAVIGATDRALEDHELIKVKLGEIDERDEIRSAADALCGGTGAQVAQIIGKTIVLYRAREKDPEITLPKK